MMEQATLEKLLDSRRTRSFQITNRVLVALEEFAKANDITVSEAMRRIAERWYTQEYLVWQSNQPKFCMDKLPTIGE